MDKVGYPRGLIRYTTEHRLMGKPSHILRPRVIGYSTAVVAMIVLFIIVLINREPFSIDVIRDRGQLYHETTKGEVRNDYTLKLMNKTQQSETLELKAKLDGEVSVRLTPELPITLEPGEVRTLPVSVFVKKADLKRPIIDNTFEVCELQGDLCTEETSRFFGPQKHAR